MTLGEKLQKLRKDQKMSQEELASKITVSRQAVSKWELNEALPDTENLIQLSKVLGVSIDYLLNNEIENIEETPILKEITKKVKKEYNNLWTIVTVISIILAIIIGSFMNVTTTVVLIIASIGIIIIAGMLINYFIIKKENNT